MRKSWTRRWFEARGVKPARMDAATMAELMRGPIVTMFSAKLHVSNIRALGCLRVVDEVGDCELPTFEVEHGFECPAPAWLREHMRRHRYCLRVRDETNDPVV